MRVTATTDVTVTVTEAVGPGVMGALLAEEIAPAPQEPKPLWQPSDKQ